MLFRSVFVFVFVFVCVLCVCVCGVVLLMFCFTRWGCGDRACGGADIGEIARARANCANRGAVDRAVGDCHPIQNWIGRGQKRRSRWPDKGYQVKRWLRCKYPLDGNNIRCLSDSGIV